MAAQTFQYIKVDYNSARDATIQRLRARFPGVWNDFSTGNFGVMFIDAVAWATANLAYTANRLAAENFVSTMTLRESAVRLGNLVSYRLRSAAPATVPCDATLTAPAVAAVTLSKGTPVRTGDALALTFELSDNYTIEIGQTTPQRTVATFDPAGTGSRNIQALLAMTSGNADADCLDTTVDLRQFVSVGQLLIPAGQTDTYQVASVEVAPGAVSFNRLVLTTPWAGVTKTDTATVVDRRVFFVQGQTQLDQVQAPATNSANLVVKLANLPVIDGSITVAINGMDWLPVENLAEADGDQRVFQVKTLPTGATVVLFGDNKFGQAVPTEAIVAVTYRTGGGVVGNIPARAVNTTITGLVTSLSNPLTVAVINNQPGSGGLDIEGLEEARTAIPAFTRSNDRAVTLADYQALAVGFSSQFGQVRYARATVRGQNALLEGNVVVVFAWSAGPNNLLVSLATPLKSALQNFLQTKAVGTDYVLVADGDQQPFPLAVLFKAGPGSNPSDVSSLIRDAAAGYISGLAPGDPAVYASLFSQVLAVPGVASMVFATPIRDLQPVNNVAVFAAPGDFSDYTVTLSSATEGFFSGQLPVAPLTAWAFSATLGGQPLVITPDNTPGFARLLGGPLDPGQVSTINLATGLAQLYAANPVGEFIITLTTAQGYSSERVVDLYAGYTGDTTQAKRREVRATVRAWADGLAVGATLFAETLAGVRASQVSLETVVASVAGVASATFTAIGAPTNSAPRLDVGENERISIRSVYLNNQID